MSKPVSMIELFYDLVFVYMISQATALIHHLHQGTIPITSLVIFIFVVIVFINSWMIQSVFVNRYGQSSWTDITFSFIDMMIVLYMSNSFSANLWSNPQPFYFSAGLLSLTLCLQYAIVFIKTKSNIDKAISRSFVLILVVRTGSLLIAGILSGIPGLVIATIGVLISWIAPAFTGGYTSKHPIVFSHLLERLTELSIVLFGETIVGIATFFTQTTFSIASILVFLVVATLFFTYITEFDHLIDEHRSGETGNRLIYLHYPIIFGISMITVAVKFVSETEANHFFAISFLYLGIALFYFGIWLANHYNQAQYISTVQQLWWFYGIEILAYCVSLITQSFLGVMLITFIAAGLCCAYLIMQMYQHN